MPEGDPLHGWLHTAEVGHSPLNGILRSRATNAEPQRQRLKFEELVHETGPDGRCRIGVRLEWCGKTIEHTAEGLETHHGRLRASADAALSAATEATSNRVHLDMVGVKAVRAFDGWVVVVRANGEANEHTYKLLGCAACEEDTNLLRTVAMAVLDATNRLLERYVAPAP